MVQRIAGKPPDALRGGKIPRLSTCRGRGESSRRAVSSSGQPPQPDEAEEQRPTRSTAPRREAETSRSNSNVSFLQGTQGVGVTDTTFLNANGDYTRHSSDINITLHNHSGRGADDGGPGNVATLQRVSASPVDNRRASPTNDLQPLGHHGFASSAHGYPTYESFPVDEWIPSSTPAPVRKSCEIYQSQLATKGRGYPLWKPGPNNNLPSAYQRAGMSIGDVGTFTDSGGFDFLFNICLPADHPINREGGVPEGFYPVQNLRRCDIQRHAEFHPGSYLCSQDIKTSQYNGDLSRGLAFESSASEGAILTMPSGATSTELTSVLDFEDYMALHIENWYKFIIGVRSRKVENGGVRLVIGCDKSSTWGMATLANTSQREPSHLTFKAAVPSASGPPHTWDCSGMVEAKIGPTADEIDMLNEDPGPSSTSSYENQCLFVKTLNATFDDETWCNLNARIKASRLKARGSQRFSPSFCSSQAPSPSSGNDCSDAGAATGDSTNNYALSLALPVVQIVHSEPTTMLAHPSNVINKLLLDHFKKSSDCVKTIITSDTHWSSVLSKDDVTLPSEEELFSRIIKTYTPRFDADSGIVRLEAISSEASAEEVFSPAWSSADLFSPSGLGDKVDTVFHARIQNEEQEKGPSTATAKERIPKKKALLIGINYAPGRNAERRDTQDNRAEPPQPLRKKRRLNKEPDRRPLLTGSHKDVAALKSLLEENYGYAPQDIVLLVDDDDPSNMKPTKANIIAQLEKLVDDAESRDRFIFLFSGHSNQQPEAHDEMREEDGQEEFIIACDGQSISNHELRTRLIEPLPPGCSLTAIFDCCHSGSSRLHDQRNQHHDPGPWVNDEQEGTNRRKQRVEEGYHSSIPNSFKVRYQPSGVSLTTSTRYSIQPMDTSWDLGTGSNHGMTSPERPQDDQNSQDSRAQAHLPEDLADSQRMSSIPTPIGPLASASWQDLSHESQTACDGRYEESSSPGHDSDSMPRPELLCFSFAKDSLEEREGASATQYLIKILRENPQRMLNEVLTLISHHIGKYYVGLYERSCTTSPREIAPLSTSFARFSLLRPSGPVALQLLGYQRVCLF